MQAGTSHDLGDNFAKAFGTQFLNEAGDLVHPQQSSWGASTRLIGGIIMTHGAAPSSIGLAWLLRPVLAPLGLLMWQEDMAGHVASLMTVLCWLTCKYTQVSGVTHFSSPGSY